MLPCSGRQNSAMPCLGCCLLFGMSSAAPSGCGGAWLSPHPQGRTSAHTSPPLAHPSSLGGDAHPAGPPRRQPGTLLSPALPVPALCPQDTLSPLPATLAPCLRLLCLRGLPTGTRVSRCPGVPSLPAVFPATRGPQTPRAKVLFLGPSLGRCPRRTVLCPGKGIRTGRARELCREAGTAGPQSCAHGCPGEPELAAVCGAGSAEPYPPSMGTLGSVRALLLCVPSALPFPAHKPFFWPCPSVFTPSCPCQVAAGHQPPVGAPAVPSSPRPC